MTSKLLIEICALFASLFVVGSMACLPAFHGDVRAFLRSSLWVKICMWVPIFAVFCVVLFGQEWAAWVVVAALTALGLHEVFQLRAGRHWYVWLYFAAVVAGLVHLPLIFNRFSQAQAVHIVIIICFASVLSDVCAFFAGTYAGRHHLPAFINSRKSYEGVAGQIVGAFVGVGLVALLPEFHFSWVIALGIGSASALGDICNSIVKRSLGVKDWGQTIPGHGGVLDRFSSLSFAIAAGYWLAASGVLF